MARRGPHDRQKRRPHPRPRPIPNPVPTPVPVPPPAPKPPPAPTPVPVPTPVPPVVAAPIRLTTRLNRAGRLRVETNVNIQVTDGPGDVFNVMNYGAHANGSTTDVDHIQSAITAANGGTVYFPSGTYYLGSTLTVPNGTTFLGAGISATHLKGKFVFGSSSSFTDMKVGNSGKAIVQKDEGTDNTTFTRVQFRGGGGSWGDNAVIWLNNYVHDLTFTDCNVEANLGTSSESDHSGIFDNIRVDPDVTGESIHDILWKGCTFGVSNGLITGGPLFNIEIWEDHRAGTRTNGVHDFNFEDCIFEACHSANIDYSGCTLSSDNITPASGYSHVTGCTFKGNGKGSAPSWGNDITTENGAGYVTMTGNTFYRGWQCAWGDYKEAGEGGHNVFSNNTIDATNNVLNTGITHWEDLAYIRIATHYNTITNNTINTGADELAIDFETGGDNNTVTGNDITSPSGDDSCIQNDGNNNTISGNTYH